jgi:hypothetical protein
MTRRGEASAAERSELHAALSVGSILAVGGTLDKGAPSELLSIT